MEARRGIDDESLLRLAAVAVHENVLREYEALEDGSVPQLSEAEIQAGWERAMKKYQRGEWLRRLKAFPRELLRKLLALLAALSMLGGGVAVTVMAINPSIREMVLTDFGEYTDVRFIFSNGSGQSRLSYPEDWTDNYYPSYIPKEFTLLKVFNTSISHTLIYVNEAEITLLFQIFSPTSNPGINTENLMAEEIEINEHFAILYTSEDDKRSVLLINYGEAVIHICGPISSAEIVKIAENITEK